MPLDTFPYRLLLAAAIGACVLLAIRVRLRPIVFVAFLVGLVVVLVCLTPNVARNGFHGQMHWAYAMATMRSTPPEDPAFAGQPLLYPWTAHWLYAHAGRALHITPLVILNLTDVLWLAMMLLSAAAAAMLLAPPHARRPIGVAAAYLAWTGLLLTDNTYIDFLRPHFNAVGYCMRMVPADKFFNPNNNPIGLGLGALGVFCIVRLLARPERSLLSMLGLFIAAGGCAIAYPICFLGLVVFAGAGSTAVAITTRRFFDPRLLRAVLTTALAGALALPLMLKFDAHRGPQARIAFIHLDQVPDKCIMLAAVAWAVGLALVVTTFLNARRTAVSSSNPQSEICNPQSSARTMLLAGTAGLWATYVALFVPLRCEYKFVALAAIPIAALMAGPISALAAARGFRAVVAWGILGIACLGPADRILLRFDLDTPLNIRFDHGFGRAHAIDTDHDALLTHLREHTPRNAVVLAEDPLVMTLGERSLYILPNSCGTVAGDGWSMGRWTIALKVIGQPKDAFLHRGDLQKKLLEAKDAASAREPAVALRGEFPGRAVYAVVGAEEVRAALRSSEDWASVHRGDGAEVFELVVK